MWSYGNEKEMPLSCTKSCIASFEEVVALSKKVSFVMLVVFYLELVFAFLNFDSAFHNCRVQRAR